MKKLIILVTGVGGDIAQGIIKCLEDIRNDYDISLIGCDMDEYAAGRVKCRAFHKAPSALDGDAYLDFILTLIDKEKPDYILPTTETEIEFYNEHREFFRDKGTRILINKPQIIGTFLDKVETVNFLKDRGLPYPETDLMENSRSIRRFPVVLKHRKGHGGKGLVVANTMEELDFFKKREKGLIIQEMVGDATEEYTAGVFRHNGKTHSICFNRILGYGSLTKFAELVHEKELKDIVEKIAEAVDLEGSLNVQLRKGSSGYVPFEINPRFSSTVYIRHHFGFQDVKWWIDLYEGNPIQYEPVYKKGIAVKKIDEIFYDLGKV